jgi:hypothetical protein
VVLVSLTQISTSPQCSLWWSDLPGNISEDAPNLPIPRSPPEPVQWDSWKTSWNGRFRQAEALSSLKKAVLPFGTSPAAEYDTAAGENPDISCFRRIHVVPFQGDLLRSLIDIGTRYRNLLLKYAAGFDPDRPQLPPGFSGTLKGILDELDTLRKTGIAPNSELDARQGPADAKAALLQWMTRTTALLQHPLDDPLMRPRVSEIQIDALIRWLTPPTRLDHLPNHQYRAAPRPTLADDYSNQIYRLRLNSRQVRGFGVLHENVDPSSVAAHFPHDDDDDDYRYPEYEYPYHEYEYPYHEYEYPYPEY